MNVSAALYTFINIHAEDDLAQLLLAAGRYPEVDVPFAVEQIRARRYIRDKLPTWYRNEALLFPSKMAVEQCSSEQTALYKQRLLQNARHVCDLTGGLGVDASIFALKANHVTYIERLKPCFDIAMFNFKQLKIQNITGHNDDAATVFGKIKEVDMFYIDPSRRDAANSRFIALSDCEPDIAQLMPGLLAVAPKVMAKLSPMLDISHTLALLPETTEIHVVSVKNECKELLFVCERDGDDFASRQGRDDFRSRHGSEDFLGLNRSDLFWKQRDNEVCDPVIHCINFTSAGIEQNFSFTLSDEQSEACKIGSTVQTYLYEPNASILKAGGFKQTAIRTNVEKLHKNSHLYTSSSLIEDFPGRIFKVEEVLPFSTKTFKQLHRIVPQANIAVRNFPLTVSELRRRTRIADGGETYLFATTLADESKVLIVCKKSVAGSYA
ncbi:MAG: SAM-dependent methyltransferase [Tannerella sp.]|jgi:hypothetical protein|nr:SAM-dependent methyltransferase [Tannerella sp.]